MFVGDEATTTFFGRVLMNINFFDLWQLWIMGIGLSMLGSIDRQRAQWTLVALWVMWLFGGAGLEVLGAQAGLSAVGERGISCIGRAYSPADIRDQPRAFASVLEHIEEREVQILYTQIDRDDQQAAL